MAFLDALIARLVDNSTLSHDERSVENLFHALFQGVNGNPNVVGIGGLAGLQDRFEKVGLGYIVQSWTGAGPNLPVTQAQLRAVLGDEAVRVIANASARENRDILTELSILLPGVVRRITHGTE